MSRDFERLEENLSIFIVHMHEKNQEEKYTSKAKNRKPTAAADNQVSDSEDDSSTDGSSLSDELSDDN